MAGRRPLGGGAVRRNFTLTDEHVAMLNALPGDSESAKIRRLIEQAHKEQRVVNAPIPVATYNSADIRNVAQSAGATHMYRIGSGYSDGNPDNPNSRCEFFALIDRNGAEWRVADTNGDPVWEEQDQAAFAELAEACSVSLG